MSGLIDPEIRCGEVRTIDRAPRSTLSRRDSSSVISLFPVYLFIIFEIYTECLLIISFGTCHIILYPYTTKVQSTSVPIGAMLLDTIQIVILSVHI